MRATSAPAPRRRGFLSTIEHPALQLIWDPANASILGETPFPDGYDSLPANRIAHVHAKDCFVKDHKPVWGAVGEMGIDWRGQIDALRRDGYRRLDQPRDPLDRARTATSSKPARSADGT